METHVLGLNIVNASHSHQMHDEAAARERDFRSDFLHTLGAFTPHRSGIEVGGEASFVSEVLLGG